MVQTLSNNEIIKIQPRGVITIPRKFRDKNFVGESYIRMTKIKGKLILEPVSIINYAVRKYSDKEVDEFLEMDKHESVF